MFSNCSGVLQRLAGSEGMGEYARPLGSREPHGVWSSGWRGSSGRGGVMGDRGRSRWSEGAGVVSVIYLARRFLNGAFSSLDSGLGVDLLLVLCWEEVDSVPSSTLAE